MTFKKIGKVFKSKFVGTGPSSYEERIYRAAVSQHCYRKPHISFHRCVNEVFAVPRCSVISYLLLGQAVSLIFKNWLTLEDGTDRLS